METEKAPKKTWQTWISDISFVICVVFILVAALQSFELIDVLTEDAWRNAAAFGILAFVFERAAKLKK